MLRKIFDLYQGDPESEYIMRHADLEQIKHLRRENYQILLDALPRNLRGIQPVFPELTPQAVPSHASFYVEDRDRFLRYLTENSIPYKVFWPVGPLVALTGHDTVRYVYEHIVSLFCDQHCTRSDMLYLANVLAQYPG